MELTHGFWAPYQPDNYAGKEHWLGMNFHSLGRWNDFDGGHGLGRLCQYDIFGCDIGWTKLEHTRKCYKYNSYKKTWKNAKRMCELEGANLASIHDKQTNDFLANLSGGQWVWIGGYQDEQDNWQWSDGSPFMELTHGFWAPYQPDNYAGKEHLLGMNFYSFGRWNDFDSGHQLGVICQKDVYPSTGDYWDGGCVKDSNNRLLPDLEDVGSTNSLTKCRQLCSSKGYSYMGVQAVTWCLCGHNPPPQYSRVSQGECNQRCPGNSGEMCGASWRMNVYSINTGFFSARSSSQYGSSYGPLTAIDGKISHNNWVFFHSQIESNPWLELSMPDGYISGVEIVTRYGCCADRVRDIEVRAGVDPVPEGFKGRLTINSKVATFVGPADDNLKTYRINFDRSVRAKYVTLQRIGVGTLEINEVTMIKSHPDECLMEENTDYPGMDLNLQTGRTTDRRNSALACRDLCNQNKDCKYFGWKAHSRECWLKTGISGTVVESGTTSGMACKKTGSSQSIYGDCIPNGSNCEVRYNNCASDAEAISTYVHRAAACVCKCCVDENENYSSWLSDGVECGLPNLVTENFTFFE